jgi:hypothetical protein
MSKHEFWYDETITYKGWFEAENTEEAQEMLDALQAGNLSFDDLPEFQSKDKNYTLEVDKPTRMENN